MCCPTGAGAITRGIMSSRNLRQTIIRRRKHEPKPRQVILRRRKCKRNPRHIILRVRKRKRNLRHTILRQRKCKRKPRRFIIRHRNANRNRGTSSYGGGWSKRNPVLAVTRGWMEQRISERHYTAGNENNSFYQLFKICNNYD